MGNVPLGRRLGFYWTIFRLVVGAALGLLVVAIIFYSAARDFSSGFVENSAKVAAIGAALLGLLAAIGVALRGFIRKGMQDELRRRNCCPRCEYDLRGSGGAWRRCPECGFKSVTRSIEI